LGAGNVLNFTTKKYYKLLMCTRAGRTRGMHTGGIRKIWERPSSVAYK